MSAQKRAARRSARTYGDVQHQNLQRNTFRYFWEETNQANGLIPDNTAADDVPASIAGVGFALAAYPVAVERLFVVATIIAAVGFLIWFAFFAGAPFQ